LIKVDLLFPLKIFKKRIKVVH